MIAALYSSRQQGTKEFTKDNQQFGWKTVETVFAQEMERAENGLSRKVPGLKYAFVYRDNWTRLNVWPAKIMQVFHYFPIYMNIFGHTTSSLGHNFANKFSWDILSCYTSKNVLKIKGLYHGIFFLILHPFNYSNDL